jgi:glycosyltransferase involved in cell wall biosynthesis
MQDAKVALVHDWLTGQRGGEKVLEIFAEIFPDAPIYTLFHFPGSQIEEIEHRTIHTSFLQRMPFLKKRYRLYLPLYPVSVELFNLQDYDFVISSSHCVAKGAIPQPDALHICYVHSPVRYAWNQYFSYFSSENMGLFSRYMIPFVIHRLRQWDVSTSFRVDYFIANSKTVAQRIYRYYRRTAQVIHPPVDTEFFRPGETQGEYFLIVSALVPYKRIDLAVEAFNKSGVLLKIVGAGPEYKRLKKRAKKNVDFLGFLPPNDLLQVYQRARALLMPGEEDFGINSLEAQACGVPVLAYGRGGATETVIPSDTGLFFPELTIDSLQEAVNKFLHITFDKTAIRANALRFSRDIFKKKILSYLQEKWNDHLGQK